MCDLMIVIILILMPLKYDNKLFQKHSEVGVFPVCVIQRFILGFVFKLFGYFCRE